MYIFQPQGGIFQLRICHKVLNMIGTKVFIYNSIIWLTTSSRLLTGAEENLSNSQTGFNETQSLKISPGIMFSSTDGEIVINVRMYDLLQGIYNVPFALTSHH